MKMDITTGRLPLQFLIVGPVVLLISIVMIFTSNWLGILLIILGLFSFIRSGITIDFDKKRLKEYVGLFIIKKGKWKDVSSATKLEIKKSSWSQENNVLTISTVTTVPTSSLFLILPDKKIQLMQGKKNRVKKGRKNSFAP